MYRGENVCFMKKKIFVYMKKKTYIFFSLFPLSPRGAKFLNGRVRLECSFFLDGFPYITCFGKHYLKSNICIPSICVLAVYMVYICVLPVSLVGICVLLGIS